VLRGWRTGRRLYDLAVVRLRDRHPRHATVHVAHTAGQQESATSSIDCRPRVTRQEDIKPSLVVVDSWINCLAAAGLDENSSVDIDTRSAPFSRSQVA
jgi:hypothetical protein